MNEQHANQSLDVSHVAERLPSLCDYVAGATARVEITRNGSQHRCVLISQRELESLERALEILSEFEPARQARRELEQIAAEVGK